MGVTSDVSAFWTTDGHVQSKSFPSGFFYGAGRDPLQIQETFKGIIQDFFKSWCRIPGCPDHFGKGQSGFSGSEIDTDLFGTLLVGNSRFGQDVRLSWSFTARSYLVSFFSVAFWRLRWYFSWAAIPARWLWWTLTGFTNRPFIESLD